MCEADSGAVISLGNSWGPTDYDTGCDHTSFPPTPCDYCYDTVCHGCDTFHECLQKKEYLAAKPKFDIQIAKARENTILALSRKLLKLAEEKRTVTNQLKALTEVLYAARILEKHPGIIPIDELISLTSKLEAANVLVE